MAAILSRLDECILRLHEIGVVKFGDFTLKSGMQSPVYFDLRIIVSYPSLLGTVSSLLWESAASSCDRLCGVAYTGIPLATAICLKQDIPMLVRRKESKTYGTKKMVEGEFMPGETCLIVEDVLVSGTSVYETVQTLRDMKLSVSDAVVFLDREQGGRNNLKKLGIDIAPVVTLTQMMAVLEREGRVTAAKSAEVLTFIANNNNTTIPVAPTVVANDNSSNRLTQSYTARLAQSSGSHPSVGRLLAIMDRKRTNVCLSADVDSAKELLSLAGQMGPHICALKTHSDILPDCSASVIEDLKALAKQHDFLLFEDRKYVDIGSTVVGQHKRHSLWADLVTAAPLGGPGVVKGINTAGNDTGVLLLAEMSSAGAHVCSSYSSLCVKIAEDFPSAVAGFVCQSPLSLHPGLIQLTPGVSLNASGDSFGQQYRSPTDAVLKHGADVIIVGRGVLTADDKLATMQQYKQQAFAAYLERCKQ